MLGGLLLVGCSADPGGIWLFTIDASEGLDCETTVDSHNFLGILEGEATDPWTEATTYEASAEMRFGQSIEDASNNWVLILGDSVYQGVLKGESWSFTWENSEDGSELLSHQAGYSFQHQWTGKIDTEMVLTQDNWGEQVGLASGQLPAGDYMLVNRGGGGDGPAVEAASNRRDAPDCEGEECVLEVTTQCDDSRSFTASRYDWDDEVPVDFLEDAVEEQGLGE